MKRNFKDWLYKNRYSLQFLSLLFISLMMILLSRPYYRSGFAGIGFSVTSLFQRAAHESGEAVSGAGNRLQSRKQLLESNNTLRKRVDELERVIAGQADLKNRAFLAKQIQSSQLSISPFEAVGTTLMARSSDPLGNSFIISSGSAASIRQDDTVVALTPAGPALVGRVVATTPYSASVRPVYHRSSAIGSRLEKGRFEGLLRGTGHPDSPMKLFYVSREAEEVINPGDKVITSGLSSIYPPGILIGTIRKMKRDFEGPALELGVEAAVDFRKVETLYVLTTPQDISPDPAKGRGQS